MHKQYKVLKTLEKCKKADRDLYNSLHYSKNDINEELKILAEQDFITDIFNPIPENIKTIEITNKGYLFIDSYREETVRRIASNIIWAVIGAVISSVITSLLIK